MIAVADGLRLIAGVAFLILLAGFVLALLCGLPRDDEEA